MSDSTASLTDPRLVTFVRAAEDYCVALETFADRERRDVLRELHRSLVTLYAAALALPSRDTLMPAEPAASTFEGSRGGGAVVYPLVSGEQRQALAAELSTYLGSADDYIDLLDAPPAECEIIRASLAQDLTGIYQDLRAGLSTWETQGVAYGLWHWRTFFEISWNRKLSGALRAFEARARAGDSEWPAG